MEVRVTENSVNIENWVVQDSGGKKAEEGNGAAPNKRPAPRWCPRGITKTQKCRLQKMCQRELAETKEEEVWDNWFNRLWHVTKPKQTWREKWLAKEEGCSSGDISGEEASKVTPARGEDNLESGDGNPESGNCNPKLANCHPESGNSNPGKENDQQGEESVPMDVNMVFTILAEFCAPMKDITELVLGAERAMFKKLENLGAHMKPLFIQGRLDGMLIGQMLIDGGASVNILPLSLFKKLGHVKGDLKRTNLSLSGFAGDLMEAKGIICKEVMVGSKTVPTAFFVVDMKGCYNICSNRIGYTPTSVS
jgi:hypothetical protein